MATRTILSPGVEIFEKDFSVIAPQNVGTNVFIAGYAAQGPTDEILKITSRSELDQIYGPPTNSSERYFYHGIRELLNSSASIYTARLPYGAGAGAGFGSEFSALVYPVVSITNQVLSATTPADIATLSGQATSNLAISAGTYVLGAPAHIVLTEDQYQQALEGTLFTWSATSAPAANLSNLSQLGQYGVIILNKSQTTVSSQFEGYYVGIADNSNINPASNYDAVIGVKTITLSAPIITDGLSSMGPTYTDVPFGTLQFHLSATPNGNSGSVSQVMENLTDYNIDGPTDDDLLNVGVFKIRKALYATETYKLDYILEGANVGSIDYFRTKVNPTGAGAAISLFLENVDTNDRNIEILVNPYISNKNGVTSIGPTGIPAKKIRVLTHSFAESISAMGINSSLSASSLTAGNTFGVLWPQLPVLINNLGFADYLFTVSSYGGATVTGKELGSIPSKVERALEKIKNDEIYDIDVLVEAGLGTMHVVTTALCSTYYDDTIYNATLSAAFQSLRTSNDLGALGEDVRGNYSVIFNKFENFCNLPSNTGGRGDCVFIADVLRHIMIVGKNTKVLSDRNKTFQTDIYWAMRHQLELENTSYACVYGNWAQKYDEFLGDKIWVPFSPVAATAFAKNDAAEFPWSAPAGYTRGLVSGDVVNIAITPNQKQRDELYKSSINPVLFSPSQGIAIFGQKTLSRKPSAFDRINVRRCFLALERPTKKASIFFVFEPNTEFTRTRFVNTITPIFEFAKQNQGIYDYLIVCDERNNTPQVIDSNELRADIYIKPVRTAEFIIVTFIATRTDANFEELING